LFLWFGETVTAVEEPNSPCWSLASGTAKRSSKL